MYRAITLSVFNPRQSVATLNSDCKRISITLGKSVQRPDKTSSTGNVIIVLSITDTGDNHVPG